MTVRRALALGAAAMAAYVAVAIGTLHATGTVRPLYEGFAPPPRYQWVNPPREFAAGNVKPTQTQKDAQLGANGSESVDSFSSSENQFLLSFAPGAIAAHDPDTSAQVTITPLDPATLGATPRGLRADGNAYRAQVVYQPSNTPVATFASPGNVVLEAPDVAVTILYSTDARTWTRLDSNAVGSATFIGAAFTRSGYYLAAAEPVSAKKSSSRVGLIAVAVGVVALALALGFAPALRRRVTRRRKQTTPRKRTPAQPRRRR